MNAPTAIVEVYLNIWRWSLWQQFVGWIYQVAYASIILLSSGSTNCCVGRCFLIWCRSKAVNRVVVVHLLLFFRLFVFVFAKGKCWFDFIIWVVILVLVSQWLLLFRLWYSSAALFGWRVEVLMHTLTIFWRHLRLIRGSDRDGVGRARKIALLRYMWLIIQCSDLIALADDVVVRAAAILLINVGFSQLVKFNMLICLLKVLIQTGEGLLVGG